MQSLLQPRVDKILNHLKARNNGMTCADQIGVTGDSQVHIHTYLETLVRFGRVVYIRDIKTGQVKYYTPEAMQTTPPEPAQVTPPIELTPPLPEKKGKKRKWKKPPGRKSRVQQGVLDALQRLGSANSAAIIRESGLTKSQVTNSLYYLRLKKQVHRLNRKDYTL